MAKSEFAHAVDEIRKALRPFLKAHGFRARGRTFNRLTEDQLTQVVNIQMGPSDPPGTTYIPGLRENMHGLFTVNLGVYIPEVAKYHGSVASSWVQEYHCDVRSRLGEDPNGQRENRWHARNDPVVISDVRCKLEKAGLPFLERFSTRDRILAAWRGRVGNMGASSPPRIVLAIILANRGRRDEASRLLARQAAEAETSHPGHANYVRRLARDLSLVDLV